MGESPQEGTENLQSVGEGGLDQSDLDALFAAASGDTASEVVSDSSSDAGDASGAEAGSQDQAGEDSTGSFSQDDIDALMSGESASGDDGESVSGSNAAASDSGSSVAGEGAGAGAGDERLDSLGRPFDEAAAAMQAAIEEERLAAEKAKSEPTPLPPGVEPAELPSFDQSVPTTIDAQRVTMLNDVDLRVRVQLGRTKMLVEDILKLGEGSVVELDKLAGDPVDVLVNDRLIARGEVLVLNDNFCVRVSEVVSNDPHRITI